MDNLNLDLANFVAMQGVNTVEIYIRARNSNSSDNGLCIPIDGIPKAKIITFGGGYETKLANYFYKDLCYSYDLANDAQRVIKRNVLQDINQGDNISTRKNTMACYVLCINEDTLPSHRFPCVREVSHTNVVNRTSYRINNRMYVIHESECTEEDEKEKDKHYENQLLYVRYNHAPQVDLKQMQNDLDKVLKLLHKTYITRNT